jgi:hypothetical protein
MSNGFNPTPFVIGTVLSSNGSLKTVKTVRTIMLIDINKKERQNIGS